ncbi:MAG: hypothetical protein ACYCX2_00480 [Christensenellales bacterium]
MNTNQKLMIFPFHRKIVSLVSFLLTLGFQPENINAVTFPGFGLVGKDVSYAIDGREIGVRVQENIQKALSTCDVLLIADGYFENTKPIILGTIEEALKMGKHVHCALKFAEDEMAKIKDLPHYQNRFSYLVRNADSVTHKIYDKLFPIRTPVILVCDLFGDTVSADFFLKIVSEFLRKGYQVCGLSNDPNTELLGIPAVNHFFTSPLTDDQKILSFNNYLHKLETNARGLDLFLIHVPGGMMMLKQTMPISFGTDIFRLVNAVQIDYTVLCVPYNMIEPGESIGAHCTAINNRYGISINAIVAGNMIIDTLETTDISYIYHPYFRVEDYLKGINFKKRKFLSITQDNIAEQLCKDIVDTLSAN